jgi:hypothetical protein
MDETSGVLKPAIQAYLSGDPMTEVEVEVVRAYLRQWIEAPVWKGALEQLREDIDGLTSREAISDWLDLAEEEGIDPL